MDRPLIIGTRGSPLALWQLFTKELEQALIEGDIDMSVHSMKDVPTQHQAGLQISAVLPRADHRDGFISKKYKSIDDLPRGALVGTASWY